MKTPSQFTNEDLALHIELWMMLNEELTDSQKKYFEEVIWRLRLMNNTEKEK